MPPSGEPDTVLLLMERRRLAGHTEFGVESCCSLGWLDGLAETADGCSHWMAKVEDATTAVPALSSVTLTLRISSPGSVSDMSSWRYPCSSL